MNFRNICKYIILLLITISISNCKESEDEIGNCNSTDSSIIKFDMFKLNSECNEIELLWDISFGVELIWEIEIDCGNECDEWQVFYRKRELRKHSAGVEIYNEGINSNTIINCNQIITKGVTPNIRIDDPDPEARKYEIGDTLVYEFLDPEICRSIEPLGCESEREPIDLPSFYFEYILTEDDFNCM